MEQALQKSQTALLKLQVPHSTRCLLNAVAKGQQQLILTTVEKYIERGVVKFDEVMKISLHSRIPNLTHVYGFDKIQEIVAALLTSFSNSFNLIRPMTAEQVFDCSYELVMTSQEDQLSIEDYVLFFRGAKEGKYGKILDRLDQQTVFELLEQYRDQRHKKLIAVRQEQDVQYKSLPVDDRISDMFQSEKEKMKEAQIEHLKSQPVQE